MGTVVLLQAHIMVRVMPWRHILHQARLYFFNAPGETDSILNANMAKMIYRQRNVITDDVTDLLT